MEFAGKFARLWAEKVKSRGASMETEQSELVIPRQLLCCKLCDEEFTEPCYLPCLHTFCQNCIDKHRLNSTDNDGYFPCPTCMTEVSPEEEDGAAALPINILARRLSVPVIDPVKRETLCFYCKNAGNFVEGKTHCIDCDEFLCKLCADSHTRQEEFSDHQLQSEEDYNADLEKSSCTTVQGQVIPICCDAYDPLDIGAMFCVGCDIAVCADCHVNKHGEHRCAELTAIAQHFEKKIKEPLKELDNDSEEISAFLSDLDVKEHTILEQKDALKQHVQDRTKQLCSLIKDYEKLLLDDIERRFDDQIEDIKARRLDLEMHLEAIKGVKDFTENLLTYGSYEEKVHLRKKVGYRIRELCEESLGTEPIEIHSVRLMEPNVTGDTICDMFGTIETGNQSAHKENEHIQDSLPSSEHFQRYHSFGDSGHGSDSMDQVENEPELVEIFEKGELQRQDSKQESSDTDMLSSSNSSDKMKNVKFREQVDRNEFDIENVFNLENPKREVNLPAPIQKECIKGIGINEKGDIIVGTSTTVHVLEKRGIVRGQIPLENGWNIHSVSSDGKVSMTVPRGDNRFKVRVLKSDGTGHILYDFHVESFGLNFVTADQSGTLIITSNRYAQIHKSHGKAAKSGGNIAFYGSDGHLIRRITNDNFQANLLEKPQMVVVDQKRNRTYVADPGSHRVIALNAKGDLIFEYGNKEGEEEIYQGPDLISIDKYGNIIVTDKREGRIDILSTKGNLKKSFFTDDIPRFVGATPDKLLVTAMPDGSMKFYEYLT
ncbi:E3 ubiquitin-protein ligase TRIM56-like isoform X2 [Saccostrea cucullata]|uniref:E3 ubiquitin-protein ligase TRIM56-like isoform X2 n=1 Tax=Saccostrea cuccullata TaxID=36930 RepID=UPI002ED6239C